MDGKTLVIIKRNLEHAYKDVEDAYMLFGYNSPEMIEINKIRLICDLDNAIDALQNVKIGLKENGIEI